MALRWLKGTNKTGYLTNSNKTGSETWIAFFFNYYYYYYYYYYYAINIIVGQAVGDTVASALPLISTGHCPMRYVSTTPAEQICFTLVNVSIPTKSAVHICISAYLLWPSSSSPEDSGTDTQDSYI